MRALELFCGIGGFAMAAVDIGVEVVAALDHDQAAIDVYRHNFPGHPAVKKDLERITADDIVRLSAEMWWLSPPCQPYCVRGAGRDHGDPRARSLTRLVEILAQLPIAHLPLHLALENVPGFARSAARKSMVSVLGRRGYYLGERILCPTELGVPSRRPRYYLTASLLPLNEVPVPCARSMTPLGEYLGISRTRTDDEGLLLPEYIMEKYGSGLRILDPADPSAYTTCFTSSYGKSVMRAGSYLKCGDGARYFAPEEIARLLHFQDSFRFPEGMTLRRRWHLAGNSLSVLAVRRVVAAFQGVAH